jgi:O-antigen ligase
MEYFNRSESDSRFATARICLGMLPAAGLFGFGPGTFIAIFQHHVAEAQIHQDAIWKFAHDDWLQYFVEWGFFGGAVWLVLWSLPVRRAVEHVRVIIKPGFGLEKKRTRRSRERWSGSLEALRTYLTFGASIALAGVLVHAMMDFPLQIMSLQMYALTLAGMLVARGRHDDAFVGDEA